MKKLLERLVNESILILYGHVGCMPDDRLSKKTDGSIPNGKRGRVSQKEEMNRCNE